MREDDRIRIMHMLDAAEEILQFAKGKDRPSLDDNRMLVLAVLKEIEMIGEAANSVSDDVQGEFPKSHGAG